MITKRQIKELPRGQILTIPCANALELDSTYRVAQYAKREVIDCEIRVSRSAKTMTVTITKA